jgi:hypothetical protein
MQPELLDADISKNNLQGPILAFTDAIPNSSKLAFLSIAENRLTGTLAGLDKLGVFAPGLPSEVTVGKTPLYKKFNASSNDFEGGLPARYYAAASAGGPQQLPYLLVRVRIFWINPQAIRA